MSIENRREHAKRDLGVAGRFPDPSSHNCLQLHHDDDDDNDDDVDDDDEEEKEQEEGDNVEIYNHHKPKNFHNMS